MHALILAAALAHGPVAPAATPAAPLSAQLVIAWRPRAWQPPRSAPAAGLRVALDPATGELVAPTAADLPPRAPRGPFTAELRPDGSRRVLLNGAIRAYTVARLGVDGRLRLDCTPTPAATLAHPPAAAPAADR
jgi:hypothetical protein